MTKTNEGGKFKTIVNESFGASKLKEIVLGDIVEWDSWTNDLSSEIFSVRSGILVELWNDEKLSGWCWMAKIIPFGGGDRVTIPLISIRKKV